MNRLNSSVLYGLVALGCLLFSAPVVRADENEVHDSHLKYNSFNYFRGHSDQIEFGSYGDKKSPVTATNYLENHGKIPTDSIKKIKAVKEVIINYQKTSKNDFFANINVHQVFGGLSNDEAWGKMEKGELKLMELYADLNQMETATNNSPRALSTLKDFGNSGRIVGTVFVIMDAKTATVFKNSTSVTVSGEKDGIKVTAGASNVTSGSTSVVYPAGSTFAYGMIKFDWNKGKTRIEKLTDDQWGPN
jgi:hypothetical protein